MTNDDAVDAYWTVYGENGWAIETWQGEPRGENVIVLATIGELGENPGGIEALLDIVAELNRLSAGSVVLRGDELVRIKE